MRGLWWFDMVCNAWNFVTQPGCLELESNDDTVNEAPVWAREEKS